MANLHASVTNPLSIYPALFGRPIANRLTPVPACDALIHNASIDQLQNGLSSVAASEVKDHKSHHGYVLQQPPLDPAWISANCELPELIPLAIRLNYRSNGFPANEAFDAGCKQYKALTAAQDSADSDVKLANDSVRPLLFNQSINLELDDVWADSIRDYVRLRKTGINEYVAQCLGNNPRVPGSIFGVESNSLDNIMRLLKLCRTNNSKSGATLVNIANQLVSIVVLQAWHVINGRFLVYNPAAALQNSEVKLCSSAVLFDHSKPPTLMMTYHQRDFLPHPVLDDLVRAALKRAPQTGRRALNQKMDSGTERKGRGKGKGKGKGKRASKLLDVDALEVDEADLQTLATRTSLTTFFFLVVRCVGRIAAEYDLQRLFQTHDAFKWCRDQLGKNKALFLETMHFREMPVKDTLENFNDFSRRIFGANNVDGRLMTSPAGRWCRTRNNGSLYITKLTSPDADNVYALHVPQFYYHLFHGPTLPAIPAPPVDPTKGRVSTTAMLGTLLWALSLHTGSTMRQEVLKNIREHTEDGKESKRGGGGGSSKQRKRKAADDDADDNSEEESKEVVQVKRRRVGKKNDAKGLLVARKIRQSSLLSLHFGKFRPVLSPIRRRYCCILGPDEVLYASPPATFFVDDCVDGGLYTDESSVFMLSPTIIRCLQLQGTDHTNRLLEELTQNGEAKNPRAPHYSNMLASLASALDSEGILPAGDATPVLYTTYLALGSIVQYEADAIVTIMAMVNAQRAQRQPQQPNITPALFNAELMASYEAYIEALHTRLEGIDEQLGGVYNQLHGVMRKQWSRLSHVALLALRSAEQQSSGIGFGVLGLAAMEKYVEDNKSANGWTFLQEPRAQQQQQQEDQSRPDLWNQLAMALVNRHLPPAAELDGVAVLKKQPNNNTPIVAATATQLFVDLLVRTHLSVVVPCMQYVALKCPAPVIMHQSTAATKIAFGALPAPKVRSATESAMMELATKHTASFGDLLSSSDFVRDVSAMTDVPEKLKPALQFLFLSAPTGQRTPRMFETVNRLMGNFGRNPADAAQQQLVQDEGGLVNSARQKTKGHIQHAVIGSRDVPFFLTAADSDFKPLNPQVMVDGQQLLQLCRQGSETAAFWQCLQSFINSMMDTSVLKDAGKPRVISIPIIEAAYVRLAADLDCPIGYTLRPPSDRLMDVLWFIWLAIPDSPSRTLFRKILADTGASAKDNPRVASSPDLQVFFQRLKTKLVQFDAWRPGSLNDKGERKLQQPQMMVASTSLVHPHALRQLPPPFAGETSSSSSSNSNNSNNGGSGARPMDMNGNEHIAAMGDDDDDLR